MAEILPGIHPLAGIGPELALRTAAGGGASDPGPGMLLQSSGTTGEPKIVRRSGASLDAVAENMADACGFEPRDRVLAAVPLCHSYGVEHGLLAPVWAGSAVHAVAGFDLSLVLPELRDGGITLLPGVPFMFETLCRAGGAAGPTLRRVYSAGAPLPAAIAGEFRERFRLSIGQVYGATEIGSVTFNNPGDPSFDPAGVGVAMRDVSIRILRSCDSPEEVEPGVEGHVAIRAPSMFDGYLAGEARLVDGHYLTGDLGSVDESGRLRITGRASLLIEVGGRKVNPSEVETALRQHPRVGQCVVVPMRVSESVCRLRAIVTPARPDVEISPGELRAFARQRLSAYKVPRVFEVRAALPMSPAGKVLRQQVETA